MDNASRNRQHRLGPHRAILSNPPDDLPASEIVYLLENHNLLTPGSQAALKEGCLCPQILNYYGRLAPARPHYWWLHANCPLHTEEIRTSR